MANKNLAKNNKYLVNNHIAIQKMTNKNLAKDNKKLANKYMAN